MSKEFRDNPKWIAAVTDWLDTRFTIPKTKIKYGLDPIFSLFPIVGDLVTYLVSLLIVITIKRNGASGELIVRMLLNATVDVLIGSIPLIGTFFDIGFKSNRRNLQLMTDYYEKDKYQGNGKVLLFIMLLVVTSVIVGLLYLTYLLLAETFQFIIQL